MVADLLRGQLLTHEQAGEFGQAIINEVRSIAKQIAKLKKQATRDVSTARRKGGEVAAEQARRQAAEAVAALEQAATKLALPAPPLLPQRKRERERDPGAEYRADVEVWCKRWGEKLHSLESMRNERRLDRAVRARLWRPVGVQEHAELREKLEKREAFDDLCMCTVVPSFLCPVTWCWATAAGAMCEEREGGKPGDHCECMVQAWPGVLDAHRIPYMLRHEKREPNVPWRPIDLDLWECPTAFKWLKPNILPGGDYGRGFCPVRAGASLTHAGLVAAQDRGFCGTGGRPDMLEKNPNFGLPKTWHLI